MWGQGVQRHLHQTVGCELHYATAGPDGETLDGTVDATPVRVNNSALERPYFAKAWASDSADSRLPDPFQAQGQP